MPGLSFPVTLAGQIPVVTAPEEIDITNAEGLRTALLEAAHMHPVTVVDLSPARFCDSTGLRTIAIARKRARDQDGEVILVVTGAAVLRILELTGLDHLIPHFTALDEALTYAAKQTANNAGGDQHPDQGMAATVLDGRKP
jgi:anti-sigma B factor antagonist